MTQELACKSVTSDWNLEPGTGLETINIIQEFESGTSNWHEKHEHKSGTGMDTIKANQELESRTKKCPGRSEPGSTQTGLRSFRRWLEA